MVTIFSFLNFSYSASKKNPETLNLLFYGLFCLPVLNAHVSLFWWLGFSTSQKDLPYIHASVAVLCDSVALKISYTCGCECERRRRSYLLYSIRTATCRSLWRHHCFVMPCHHTDLIIGPCGINLNLVKFIKRY